MLDAEYGIYSDGQSHIVRTQAYSLPEMLHEHVDLVSPTIYFGRAGRPLADTIANGKNDYLNNGGKTAIPAFPYETKGEIAYNGLCNSTNVTLACMARHYGYEGYGESILHEDEMCPDRDGYTQNQRLPTRIPLVLPDTWKSVRESCFDSLSTQLKRLLHRLEFRRLVTLPEPVCAKCSHRQLHCGIRKWWHQPSRLCVRISSFMCYLYQAD